MASVLAGIDLEVLVGIHTGGIVQGIHVQVGDTSLVELRMALEGMGPVVHHDPNLPVVGVVAGRSFQDTVGSEMDCACQAAPKDVVAAGLGSGFVLVVELQIVAVEVGGCSVTR